MLLAGLPVVPACAQAIDPPLELPEPLLNTQLPPIDFGPPVELPPVAPPDPALVAPLAPLATFEADPDSDFSFTEVSEAGIRYSLKVDGLQPTGLEGQFRRLSALARGQGDPATAAQIASRTNTDRGLMERILFSEGWYSGTAEGIVDPVTGGRTTVTMLAVPGSRYSWRQITLDLIPDDKPELAQDFGLKVGDPIRAIAVEEAEGALLLKLQRSGYPFAEIGARDVVLDQAEPTGSYLLTGDIGPRGIFGSIRMTGFQPFDEEHAQVIARFEKGELYDAALVDDLRRALIQTQLFAGVTVTPFDTGLREADGSAVTDIRITGNPGPLRLLTGQLGVSTGEGVRAEVLWRHRNLIRPEGQFTARAVVGTIEQRIAADLALSNFGQRDRTLLAAAEVANLNRPAFQARTVTLSGSIARASTPIWQKRWTWGVGATLIATDERDKADDGGTTDRRTFLIAALPARIGYDRSDDLLDPQTGFRLDLEATPEISRQGGAVETYGRIIGTGSYYQGFGEKLVVAGRLRLGTIVGAERADIAPTRRLYAGGGGSVRGYDYQGVGPLSDDDTPLGGRGLMEATVEGRYRFGNFGVVGFVDIGTLTESSVPTLSDLHVGVGVGGRYFTSFGPIRVDIARAITRTQRAPVVGLYISIGQAF